jgi:hypothetical protein
MYNLTVADVHTYYVVAGDTPVLVHNCGADDLAAGMRDLLAKKAGFSGSGQKIIVDENLPPSWAEALRARGYDARSIAELKMQGASDAQINQIADQVGARVLTRDRGRQIDGGFGPNAIQVDGRINSMDSILRLLGGG